MKKDHFIVIQIKLSLDAARSGQAVRVRPRPVPSGCAVGYKRRNLGGGTDQVGCRVKS